MQGTPERTDRVLTVPNLLSLGRLLCIPLFLWLLFGRESRVTAAILLGVLGATDWVDGFIARRFDQVSEVGKVLDPTADRILLVVAGIAIWADGGIPDLIFWPVIVREVLISVAAIAIAVAGARRIDVLWVGKAAAFALMAAFPSFLLAHTVDTGEDVWRFVGWAWAVPGIALGWVAAYEYGRLVPGALAARTAGTPEEPKGVAAA